VQRVQVVALLQRRPPEAALVSSPRKSLFCFGIFNRRHARSTHKPECRRIAVELAASVKHETQQVEQLALPAPPSRQATAPACGFCGTTTEKLLLCSKCKVVRYCSADHQKQHWFVVFNFERVFLQCLAKNN
jgi:hypothetical protein